MKTISISLDDNSKQTLDELAHSSHRSRSDLVRDMLAWQQLRMTVGQMQAEATPILRHLELDTDEQIAEYADKN